MKNKCQKGKVKRIWGQSDRPFGGVCGQQLYALVGVDSIDSHKVHNNHTICKQDFNFQSNSWQLTTTCGRLLAAISCD